MGGCRGSEGDSTFNPRIQVVRVANSRDFGTLWRTESNAGRKRAEPKNCNARAKTDWRTSDFCQAGAGGLPHLEWKVSSGFLSTLLYSRRLGQAIWPLLFLATSQAGRAPRLDEVVLCPALCIVQCILHFARVVSGLRSPAGGSAPDPVCGRTGVEPGRPWSMGSGRQNF